MVPDQNNSTTPKNHNDSKEKSDLDEAYASLHNITDNTSPKRYFEEIKIKSEPQDETELDKTINTIQKPVDLRNVKIEPIDNEVNLQNHHIQNTPIKTELLHDESNPSPFNKELLRKFTLESPLPKDCLQGVKEEVKRAVKRVFEEPVESEYSEEEEEEEYYEDVPTVSGKSSFDAVKIKLLTFDIFR